MKTPNSHDKQFSVDIYRRYNPDIKNLNDEELRAHFHTSLHEQRIYSATSSTAEFLSMRWLRGNGLEIGAGGNPTPLYGNATALQNDCDSDLVFGGESLDFKGSIDDAAFVNDKSSKFDFIIASHVLEHVDSIIRAIENSCILLRPKGIAYIVVPDINFLHDKNWLPFHDFNHHILEYSKPLAYAAEHDRVYTEAAGAGIDNENEHANLSAEYKAAVKLGVLPANQRFMHHKHNYKLADWIEIFQNTRLFLSGRFDIIDIRYGHERFDCHFVLKIS